MYGYPLVNWHNYGKSPNLVGISTKNDHFQWFFVCLPEGTYIHQVLICNDRDFVHQSTECRELIGTPDVQVGIAAFSLQCLFSLNCWTRLHVCFLWYFKHMTHMTICICIWMCICHVETCIYVKMIRCKFTFMCSLFTVFTKFRLVW
jgi:hypothetical protein